MERSVVFLHSMVVLLLAKHMISSASNCICQYPNDFCAPNITDAFQPLCKISDLRKERQPDTVQGKVIGSKLVDQNKQVVSDESMAFKTRFTVQLTQVLINGSHLLLFTNNAFNIRVPLSSTCNGKLEVDMSYIVIGNVNSVGRFNNLTCCIKLPTKPKGRNSKYFGGEATSFHDVCNQT